MQDRRRNSRKPPDVNRTLTHRQLDDLRKRNMRHQWAVKAGEAMPLGLEPFTDGKH